ncbi:hypothetical protein ACGFOU_29835 [Streptomyces sp. NPDC048595]|uniref:hypothetical protein n=1 Tax=Streptomyces sp. NPDC048595 TaxID=3365576 RepID=UPI00371C7070
MGKSRAVLRRVLTFGLRAGAIPAGACAALWVFVMVLRCLNGPGGSTMEDPVLAAVAVLGSMAVGASIGAVVGLVLAYAPLRLVSSGPSRALVCFVLATALAFGEVVVMAVSSDGGYGPILLALLAMPVVGAVTAARSGHLAAARIGPAGTRLGNPGQRPLPPA